MDAARSGKRGRKRPIEDVLSDVSSAVTDLRSDFENEKSQSAKLLEETLCELRALRQEFECVKSSNNSTLQQLQQQQLNSTSTLNTAPAVSAATSAASVTLSSELPGDPTMEVMRSPAKRMSSLPEIDIVPENIRKDIVRGKYINLASLLMPVKERRFTMSGAREINIEGVCTPLKTPTDNRLLKNLTSGEFIRAFTIYKTVVCEVYPFRRDELDKYMSNLVKMASDWPGFTFYQYHVEFSTRAAEYLEKHIKVDWGEMDYNIYARVTAGKKANSCGLCSAFDHSTPFCPMSSEKQGSSKVQSISTSACRFFNTARGCYRASCDYKHVCSACTSFKHGASSSSCPKNRGQTPTANEKSA